MKSIQKIHDKLWKIDHTCDYDFAGSISYNKYVSNGEHKPENLGELVRYTLDEFVKSGEYPEEVVNAYWKLCWYYDTGEYYLQFPSYSDVKEYAYGDKSKIVKDEIINTNFGKVTYHAIGFMCIGNYYDRKDWYDVYENNINERIYRSEAEKYEEN